MGDWFQVIADPEATAAEADRLAAEVLAWLVDRGIVRPERAGCVLGEGGHAPGPNWRVAVTEPGAGLLGLGTNGLEVITGRTVFHSMDLDSIACPHCGSVAVRGAVESEWDDFLPSIESWYAGGSGIRTCDQCGQAVGLNDWRWTPDWAFGHLGFQFWNWPPLDPSFVAEVSHRLGHPTRTPSGKL